MKTKKRFICLILTLVLLLIASVSVSAATSSLTIAKGGKKQLKVAGTTIKKAVSSKKSVVSVTNKGMITAKKKGIATITVTDRKNKKHKFKITVESPSLNKKSVSIKQGKTYVLKLKNNTQKVKWSSNKKKVAAVSSKGKITAKSPGKAVITAKVANGPTYKCTVTVKKVKPTLSSFKSSEKDFLINSSEEVTFTVKASASVKKTIKLYNAKGKAVASMKDNGRNGDKKKGDGIFSCVIKVKRKSVGKDTYYAKAGSLKTGKITLYFYSGPTQKSQQEVEQVAEKFDDISNKYENAQGTVSAANVSKAISEAGSYAKKLCSGGEAVRYEVNADNVTCKLKSGLTVVYQPQVEGVDSIGSNVAMSVVTMQPCVGTYSQSLASNMRLPDNAANAIAAEFSNYSFTSSNNLDNASVSLSRIKSISSNQVVIWHGHGGYSKSLHSFLVTGEEFSWDKWMWDVSYWWDCVQDRIVQSSNGRAMITSRYIDKYCGNMNNSLIYLAACQSGKDSTLANAFLNKGAAAVVANSETILTVYNTRMENATLTRMTDVNPSTNNYYTLKEALEAAKRQHGSNDGSANRATPLIFGGTTAENYRFGDVKPGKITGRVCKAEDRSTPIANATISIYQNNSRIKTLKSDSSGSYSVQLNPGTYLVDIRANGYIGFQCYATVESNQTEYMETFLMVQGSEADTGTANGYVRNALTGAGVGSVKLEVRKNWNNPSVGTVVKTVYTTSSGWYTMELPLGNYTITASLSGYVTNSFNIVVQRSSSPIQNGTITPVGSGNTYRIVLSWDENPRDLDSHVVGTFSSGSTFHTYYSSKSAKENGIEICNLDVDDTTSYGPETITLNVSNTTPYYYYIYKYAGTGELYTSGAKVKLYQGSSLLGTYHVPANQGTGRYWNVFAIVDGRIMIKNTVTSSADVSYAVTNSAVAARTYMALNNHNTIEGCEKK